MEKKRAYSDTKKGMKLVHENPFGDTVKEKDRINYYLTQVDKARLSKDYRRVVMHLTSGLEAIRYSGELSEIEKNKYLEALEKRAKRFERTAHKEYIAKYHGDFGHEVGVGLGSDYSEMADHGYALVLTRNNIEEISKIRRKKQKSGLEHRTLAVLMAAGILAGLFFLAPNLTGNIIGNLSQTSSNWLGAVLLVAGLAGGFFWLRGR